MRFPHYMILLILLLVCSGEGFNYNIFRWPTFKLYQVPSPLQGLAKFRQKAFSSLSEIKWPIVKGIQELKNHVIDFKNSLFEKDEEGYGSNEENDHSSSYHRRPASHYGQREMRQLNNNNNNNYGFIKLSFQPPSSEFIAPPPVSTGYGPPPQSQTYNAPSIPSALSPNYGIPNSQNSNYGPPPSSYGDPQQSLYSNLHGFKPPPRRMSQHSSLQPRPVNTENQLQSSYSAINAPLSAAMAMGHILTEDEVILVGNDKIMSSRDDDIGKWKPLFRPSNPVQTNSIVENNLQHSNQHLLVGQSTFTTFDSNNKFNDGVTNRSSSVLLIANSGQRDIGTVTNSVNRSQNYLLPTRVPLNSNLNNQISPVPMSAVTFRSITRLPRVLTTPDKPFQEEIIVTDHFVGNNQQTDSQQEKRHLAQAEEALSQLVDETLLVDANQEEDSVEIEEVKPKLPSRKVVSRSPPQELAPSPIETASSDGLFLASGADSRQSSSTKFFSDLMEELNLNFMRDLIRRANLQAMLTTQGKSFCKY